ncbi:MAG TPA: hypothetical protein VGX25_02650 [Actinophytocola sp.]|nr:hypothetical protein [Actinophytocola sp.]HEV2778276.1 hypothetical protein [Actinophytocola sp.]
MTEQQFTDNWSESRRHLPPVGGLGIAAGVLIGLATVLDAVSTWTSWNG